MVDRRRVVIAQDADDPRADALGEPLRPLGLVEVREDLLGRGRRPIEQSFVEETGDGVEHHLIDRLVLVDA